MTKQRGKRKGTAHRAFSVPGGGVHVIHEELIEYVEKLQTVLREIADEAADRDGPIVITRTQWLLIDYLLSDK